MATLVTRSGKGSPLTHAEVDANFTNLNTDKLELSGGTMTGNLSLGDNDKAIFGAGSDLQIYHQTTGTTGSFISDVGAGNLFIEANNLRIRDTSENLYIFGNSGAEVQLYYDGTKKLDTTSTGIDVTGTVTADGLTVDGSSNLRSTSNSTLTLTGYSGTQDVTGTVNVGRALTTGTSSFMYLQTNDGTSLKTRQRIDSNGDISFYEDTGTTAKLTWSASDEELQLASGVALELNGWTITESGGSLYFATGGTNKMKLDASGNLDVVGSVNANATIS